MITLANTYRIQLLGLSLLLAFIFTGCIGSKSLINPKSDILIHLSDFDTGRNVAGVQVSVMVQGERGRDVFTNEDVSYIRQSDMEGRVVFRGTPNKDFYLFIDETQDRPGLDTLIAVNTLLPEGTTRLEILLERKKTVFVGQVLTIEDREPLVNAEFLISPDKRATRTLRDGTFKLELEKINTSLSYSYNVTLLGYHSAYEMMNAPKINAVNDLGTIFLERNEIIELDDDEKEGTTGSERYGKAIPD